MKVSAAGQATNGLSKTVGGCTSPGREPQGAALIFHFILNKDERALASATAKLKVSILTYFFLFC